MKLNRYSHQLNVNQSLCVLLTLIVQILGADINPRNENNSINTNNNNNNNNDTNVEQQATIKVVETTTTIAPQEPTAAGSGNSQRASTDIVINSLEDGLLVSGQSSSDRHHYEQQPVVELVAENGKPVVTLTATPAGAVEELESSYHGTKPEPRNQQDEQQDPAIIDHRPSGSESQVIVQQEYIPSQQQTTTQAPYKTQTQSSAPTSIVYSTGIQHQSQPNTVTSWYPAPTQQQATYQPIVTYAQAASNAQPVTQMQAAQPMGQQQFSGVLMAQPSNQVISVQHPTSINSIISEHQNQQQQQQQQAQATNMQQVIPMATAASPSQQSQQVVSVNGQPMILVNPNTLTNGRRISISGWLKGISSMLANIFNRREHGGLISGQSSGPLGHWIQLGPNSPHWLTTAQTVAQQGQYQHQQLQQQQQTNAGLQNRPQLASAGTNRYTYIQAPVGHQQQAGPATITVGGAQVAMVSNQQQMPQQQQQYQQGNDLQASGSFTSYATVAPPPSLNPSSGNNLQQQVTIGQYAQQANNNNNLQQVQPATSPAPQVVISPTQSAPQSSVASQSNGSARVILSSTGQSRFGRSMGASSSGLPLAHYSRYAISSD